MNFAEAAALSFSFLEQSGFQRTETSPIHVLYLAPLVRVRADWDPRSGELNAWVGLTSMAGQKGDMYSLTDLLRMVNAEVEERQEPFAVADETKLKPFLDRIAADLQTYGDPALKGDRMFFRRLETFRRAQGEELLRQMDIRHRIGADAAQAWKDRDLEKVMALYSSVDEAYLTDSERARLAYARGHRKS